MSDTYEDAKRAASGLRSRIEAAGLFAGDAMAMLKDLWGCYRDEAAACSRMAALVEWRECPTCGADLEAEADALIAARRKRL